MTLYMLLVSLAGSRIGVLTSGTSSHIGWATGTLMDVEADYIVLTTDDPVKHVVYVPTAQITRIRRDL